MRLGGEVDDRLAAVRRARDRVGVGDVALVELVLDALEVRAVARVGELVEDDDLVAGCAASRRAKCEPMKPAPPVTRMRIGAQRSRAQALAQALAPVRQLGRAALAAQHRVRRPRRRAPNSAVVMRRTRVSRPASSKIASAKSAQRAVAGRGDVVDAVRQLEHCLRRLGEMADVGRAAALVVDDRDLVALGAEAQHRAHEVLRRPAEEPRGANDPRLLAGRRLAVQLRAAVGAERRRRVRLDVRRRASSRRRRSRSTRRRAARRAPPRAARRRRSPRPRLADRPRRRRRSSTPPRAARARRREPGGGGCVTSHSARVSARASGNASASAWPSWPPAPVITTAAARVPRREDRRSRAPQVDDARVVPRHAVLVGIARRRTPR